jgi:membrane-associated phospholipid phosphatase
MTRSVQSEPLVILASVFVPAVSAGVLGWALARRWPRLDPAAPRVGSDSSRVRAEVREHLRLRMLLRRHVDPATATGLVLTVAIAVLAAVITAVGLLLLMVRTHSGLASWDLAFARWGAEHATPTSTRALRDISLLGGTVGVIGIAGVLGVLEYWRRPNRAIPALLVLTVLGQFAISNLVKAVVDRQRPAVHQLTGFSGSSFPSGHAAAAAATFAVVALLLGRGRPRWVRNALAGGAVGLATLVAASRVMLGVHWFTDVLAGIAVGWGWLAICSIAFGGRLLQFGAPIADAEDVAEPTPTTAVG